MNYSFESIDQMVPPYLTEGTRINIANALSNFPHGTKYYAYLSEYDYEVLQGDGWSNFEIIKFENGERKKVKGIVLSNSCDISSENERALPPNILFAPIMKLDNYKKLLLNNCISEESIAEKIKSIKGQKVTNIFYLPDGGQLGGDYIVPLDDVHTMPFNFFQNNAGRIKQFSLSQEGFYIFLIKLSIHFCRFHENIDRQIKSREYV